jgi:Protein of unknown function (DUF2946)
MRWRRASDCSLISGLRCDASCLYFGVEASAERLAMVGGLHELGRVGRQVAAAVVIFALMLQSVVSAATTGPTANTATDPGWVAFELCHHNGSADDGGNSSAPAGAPENSDAHCIFCLAGASYALEPPLPSAAFYIIIIAIVPWSFTVWRLPALTVDASARPRGPPPTA